MKTSKYFYSVYSECPKTNQEYIDRRCGDQDLDCPHCFGFVFVQHFRTLAMARDFCAFHKGHYRINCSGFIEYKDGVELK